MGFRADHPGPRSPAGARSRRRCLQAHLASSPLPPRPAESEDVAALLEDLKEKVQELQVGDAACITALITARIFCPFARGDGTMSS